MSFDAAKKARVLHGVEQALPGFPVAGGRYAQGSSHLGLLGLTSQSLQGDHTSNFSPRWTSAGPGSLAKVTS